MLLLVSLADLLLDFSTFTVFKPYVSSRSVPESISTGSIVPVGFGTNMDIRLNQPTREIAVKQ